MKDQIAQHIRSNLLSDAQSKKISRRDFMQGMIATGVSLSAASSLWSTKVYAQSPKKGGKFRFGLGHGQTTDTLDPATYENGFTSNMTFAYQSYLTDVGSDGNLHPALAESWEPSADASSWTFKLRPGVTFHNGKDLTPEDVIASINHHRGEGSQSAAKPIVESITDIKADGGNVVFELDSGNADFPFIISDYHLPIMPANADGTPDWQSGIGCGPYQIKNFDPGVRADLIKYADFWTDQVGHFDELEILSVVDPASRTNALISGEVDAIDRVDLKTSHLLQRSPGVVVHQVDGTTQHFTFPMHTNVAPFDNNDVRLALKYAMNREEIVEKVLQGFGSVGNDHPIGSGQRYFASELEQTSYDPERAKEHLKTAGMDSLTVDLSVADAAFAGAVDAAVLYAEHAKPAGITINVVREPNDGYWSNVWLKKPFCACYWGGRPTEDWMFATAYASGVDWNDTFFEHARFNELLLQARSELDETKRREMYVEMQTILNREGGTIIPMFASYVFATSDKVGHGEQFATDGDTDGTKGAIRWWFA